MIATVYSMIVAARRSLVYALLVLYLATGGGCGNSNQPTNSRFAQSVTDCGGEVQIYLAFDGTDISDDDLASLPFPDTVRSISLQNTSITDRGVAELRRAKNLSVVDLRNTQITDVAADELLQMPQLIYAYASTLSNTKQNELQKFLSLQRDKLDLAKQQSDRPNTPPAELLDRLK